MGAGRKVWKCPDGMHRLAACGLPPGASAEAVIILGRERIEGLGSFL